MITIPYDCPRGYKNCIAISNIMSDNSSSFFCCGENNGETRVVEQDKYTVCFKGQNRDCIDHYDKRDLIHHSSVMINALAAIEKCHDIESQNEADWSPWDDGRV